MTGSFGIGAILHWKNFQFENGTTKNKFFVVLGAKTGRNCLVVIATSQPRARSYEPGCHAEEGYFHIPGGNKDFFSKDTWLLLMECRILELAAAVKAGLEGSLKPVDQLREQLANEIRNCLKRTDDVSPVQLELL